MASTILIRNSILLKLFVVVILASASYLVGLNAFSRRKNSGARAFSLRNSFECIRLNTSNDRIIPHHTIALDELVADLDFEPHHFISFPEAKVVEFFTSCPQNFSVYCPCHDPSRAKLYMTGLLLHKERHCPQKPADKHRCLIPKPSRYKKPFSWPKSRDYAWFHNVPFKRLTVIKKSQNWVKLKGELLSFPGGGTSFPAGVDKYIAELRRVLPLKSGKIRTALDVGCGVASFGAALFSYDILTMSIAPRDIHEAQVQFALERGVPSMLEVLGMYRLPFPSKSFDMAHCSRCLVDWNSNGGQNLMEIDRLLRPGGYWVLSGPPINWKANYQGWNRTTKDLQEEQIALEDLVKRLCWKKISEIGNIAVFQKPNNHVHCIKKMKIWKSTHLCEGNNANAGWYEKMEPCVTPLPEVADVHDVSGGALEKWPKRLNSFPSSRLGISSQKFNEDTHVWKRRVGFYKSILRPLSEGKFRNVMDMNAGFGGFAAALSAYPLWVMNVLPPEGAHNLSVVYDRGLIGTYMNWCEAFSTYPRTYDLIHAYGVFSMYREKCDIVDILLEMHRILRPGGAVVVRDHVDAVVEVEGVAARMKWNGRILHSELGAFHAEKIFLVDNSLEWVQ